MLRRPGWMARASSAARTGCSAGLGGWPGQAQQPEQGALQVWVDGPGKLSQWQMPTQAAACSKDEGAGWLQGKGKTSSDLYTHNSSKQRRGAVLLLGSALKIGLNDFVVPLLCPT